MRRLIAETNITVLFEQAKEGDQAAFASLYTYLFTPLYRYVFSRLRSKEAAEDIVQRIFMKVYERLALGEKITLTESYFFVAAKNGMTDYFRKKKEVLFDTLDPEWQAIADGQATSPELLEKEARRRTLMHALEALPIKEQESLRLRFFGELSNEAIATVLVTSEANVRQLQSRGIKRLCQSLTFESSL